MKFLVDECCDAALVGHLRGAGHDVGYVAETAGGMTDDDVLRTAFDQDRFLVTEDKDFGELTVRFGKPTHGLIILRLPDATGMEKWARLSALLEKFLDHLQGFCVVVAPDVFRFRSLQPLLE